MCNSIAKSKNKYFSNWDPKLISDNKKIWKSVKPLFHWWNNLQQIINLAESGEVLSSDTDIAQMVNDYFRNVVQNLNIRRENSLLNINLCINPVLAAIEKYKHHQSNISLNEKMKKKASLNLVFIYL